MSIYTKSSILTSKELVMKVPNKCSVFVLLLPSHTSARLCDCVSTFIFLLLVFSQVGTRKPHSNWLQESVMFENSREAGSERRSCRLNLCFMSLSFSPAGTADFKVSKRHPWDLAGNMQMSLFWGSLSLWCRIKTCKTDVNKKEEVIKIQCF